MTPGLGKTRAVGTLRNGNSLKSIGLRADMDALPMEEAGMSMAVIPSEARTAGLWPAYES